MNCITDCIFFACLLCSWILCYNVVVGQPCLLWHIQGGEKQSSEFAEFSTNFQIDWMAWIIKRTFSFATDPWCHIIQESKDRVQRLTSYLLLLITFPWPRWKSNEGIEKCKGELIRICGGKREAQCSENPIVSTDEIRVEMTGRNARPHLEKTKIQHISTHTSHPLWGEGWWPTHLADIESTMNSSVHRCILESMLVHLSNSLLYVWLKLGHATGQ